MFMDVAVPGSRTKLTCSSGWFEGVRWLHHRGRQRHEWGTLLCRRVVVLIYRKVAKWFKCFAVLLRVRICSPSSKAMKARSWSCTSTTQAQTTVARCSSLQTVTGVERAGRRSPCFPIGCRSFKMNGCRLFLLQGLLWLPTWQIKGFFLNKT